MKKVLKASAAVIAVLSTGACAHVAAPRSAGPPTMLSAPSVYVNPYQDAEDCMRSQLTKPQKDTIVGIGYFAERSGRDTYSQNDAAGKILSQGSADQLINDFSAMGIIATDVSADARIMTDWQVSHTDRSKLQLPPFAMPDVLVYGSFGDVDFGYSNVHELYISGIGGGSRAYTLRYTVDARMVRAASNTTTLPFQGAVAATGEVLARAALVQNVVGYETRAGVAGFFGPQSSSTYVQMNLGNDRRELVQYSQRFVTSRTALELVKNLWGIKTCDAQIRYGDELITGRFPNGNLHLRGRQP